MPAPDASSPQPVQSLNAQGNPETLTTNRFLIFTADDSGRSQKIRVTLDSLPPPYDGSGKLERNWVGEAMWVGRPRVVTNWASIINPTDSDIGEGTPTFWAAALECTEEPHCQDWSTLGSINVFHEGIVPSRMATSTGPIEIEARYHVQVIDCDSRCPVDNQANFSPPLVATTDGFGDTVGLFCSPFPCEPPQESNSVLDWAEVFKRFSNVPGSMRKVRADLESSVGNQACVDLKINVSDASRVISGFNGLHFDTTGFAPSVKSPCDSNCSDPFSGLPGSDERQPIRLSITVSSGLADRRVPATVEDPGPGGF